MINANDENNEYPAPLSHGKLPRQFDIDVTEDVPENLRTFSNQPSLQPLQHSTIDRTELQDVSINPIAPYHPLWLKGVGKPKRVSQFGKPKQKLWHRGSELEPCFIWYPNDRKTYHDTNYPWGCVCKIINSSGGYGSGVIVGPRHVLTASHVIDWDVNSVSVEVHRSGSFFSAITAGIHARYITKITSDPGYSDVDEDYAVIITADRIGDRFGYLGVLTYDSKWDNEPHWRSIGYADDLGNRWFPIYQRDKSLDEDEVDYGSGRAMTTSADLFKGQSGSPMFGFWDTGPYVVAVVSAFGSIFLSGDENWCSGGSALTQLVNNARSLFP